MKTIKVSDETYEKIKDQLKEKAEEKGGVKILDEGGEALFISTKDNLKEAVEEAVDGEANLREADLREANLGGADLWGANLRGAELENAKFYGKGGTVKLKKDQVEDFLNALGFQVED